MKNLFTCRTNGKGLWSRTKRTIPIIDLRAVITRWGDHTSGELKAYYPITTWQNNKEGLIYTDKQWMLDFRNALLKKGFSFEAVDDIDYSEQGMQGVDYVSMDIGHTFINELDSFLQFVNGKSPAPSIITIEELIIDEDY